MSEFKYITNDPVTSNKLSRTACAILLLLYFYADDDNVLDKKRFIKRTGLEMGSRTWNKYWQELEENNVLVRTGATTWMLSPYQCYAEGRVQTAMINKWNEVQHAVS